MAIEKARMM